jgi:putative ABC transport system substrate-binding protein
MRRRQFITLLGGAAVVWPFAARAQQKAMPVVGYLSSASPATYPPAYVAAFRQGLSETGYVEGKNVFIEYRWAEDHYDRLPALAGDLAARQANVIATTGGIVSALAAKGVTSTIPIVFAMGDDPVSAGVVASFARPGGNITGISFFAVELGAKLFELATELTASAASIGILVNPKRPTYEAVLKAVETAARAKGRQLLVLDASAERDFEQLFATLAEARAGALVVTSDPLYLDRRERLVALATSHAIPTVYAWREYIAAGGLISYGPSLAGAYRQVGIYAGKILMGEKPADLPVQQPTTFELVINLKTAKALGLTVPQSILARADEVIE